MAIYTPNKSSDANSESSSLRVVFFGNELPNDDLQIHFRRLHTRSKDRNHPLLARFIDEATLVLKEEISALSTDLSRLIPTFETVLQWSEDANASLREGLLYHEILAYDKEECVHTTLAGLGIGLLSATAVALAPTPAHLPLAGADVVRLAFRLGIHVLAVSELLEARDVTGKPTSWAYLVQIADSDAAQAELDLLYGNAESSANSNKIFISAVSQTSIVASGPPSRLKVLFNKSPLFRNARSTALPVYGGLCHAAHIYGENDARSIVECASLNTVAENCTPLLPIYSTSTGNPYLVNNATETFECVISELLRKQICWDNVINGIRERIHYSGVSAAAVDHFGNSASLHDLDVALKSVLHESQVTLTNILTMSCVPPPREIAPRSTGLSKLAIVGMACRLPGGATDTEKFWDILVKGLDVSRKVPADRFDIETHYDPTGKQMNKSMTQYGCFIDEPGLFDAPFFNMSPREAQTTDPQMRLALVTAYEALEQAGYVGNRTNSTKLERIGTYYGQAADDYREVNQGQEVSTYYIPGGCRAFGPGRINYFFKFAGPSYSIDTACSSGLAAIE
ncbi:hypothetical protein E4U33_000754, partial [Claviceps sp. LM78 group G4]